MQTSILLTIAAAMANQPIYGQPRKREKVGSGINRKKTKQARKQNRKNRKK